MPWMAIWIGVIRISCIDWINWLSIWLFCKRVTASLMELLKKSSGAT